MLLKATDVSGARAQKERERTLFTAKRIVREKEQQLLLDPVGINKTTIRQLQNLCVTLHELAQKYVPNSPKTFSDFDALLQATRSVQLLCGPTTIKENLQAPLAATDNSTILNSFEYRVLRNKMIAALATIADLTFKSAPLGEMDENGFQRGVREGYRRASDIAIMFLEEVQADNGKI